ncbi:MAG: hypothetical protein D4S02_17825 [Rhodocyclaceae bacterium]|nr:MAG: hypothetical protein D4S02_17825 [Rhodocyclaceae bacterium]
MPAPQWRWALAALWMVLSPGVALADRPAPDAVIIFEAGTDSIPTTDDKVFEQLSIKAKSDPGNWISLEAYANDLGSRELNLALAQRRMEDVSRRLAMLGFPPHRIRGTSYRESSTADGDLPTRRVEIRIAKLGL